MLETAIIGAGICGLALAQGLHRQGRSFALFEARGRVGGRVLTAISRQGTPLDLGPTWFWPETQPRITRLVRDLGLRSFPQHDTGEVLSLADHDKQPDSIQRPNLHGGAQRVEGGMSAVTQALLQELPEASLHLGHVLESVTDCGDHVLLRLRLGLERIEVEARHVVLALPPRLVEEKIAFDPPLDGQVREAMRETYTWMADQAKALVAFERPFWREQGHSGNAFVHHEHVVLGEIFDACDGDGSQAAVGGFFSLPPEFRASLRGGMSMLVSSQLVQVFGTEAEHGDQHVHDWAGDDYTCSSRDRTPPDHHPEYGHPALRWPQWDEKLFFGGSETATYAGGYLEGALEAAARIQRNLSLSLKPQSVAPHSSGNQASLDQFETWVQSQREGALERYKRHLQQNLAKQVKDQITQRAVLGTMEQVYSEALALLDDLPFNAAEEGIEQGRCGLTPKLLNPFLGFNKALLDAVIAHNRTSCAMSNFPDEHHVSPEYLETIARDLAAAWREFALAVNDLMVAKASSERIAAAA